MKKLFFAVIIFIIGCMVYNNIPVTVEEYTIENGCEVYNVEVQEGKTDWFGTNIYWYIYSDDNLIYKGTYYTDEVYYDWLPEKMLHLFDTEDSSFYYQCTRSSNEYIVRYSDDVYLNDKVIGLKEDYSYSALFSEYELEHMPESIKYVTDYLTEWAELLRSNIEYSVLEERMIQAGYDPSHIYGLYNFGLTKGSIQEYISETVKDESYLIEYQEDESENRLEVWIYSDEKLIHNTHYALDYDNLPENIIYLCTENECDYYYIESRNYQYLRIDSDTPTWVNLDYINLQEDYSQQFTEEYRVKFPSLVEDEMKRYNKAAQAIRDNYTYEELEEKFEECGCNPHKILIFYNYGG